LRKVARVQRRSETLRIVLRSRPVVKTRVEANRNFGRGESRVCEHGLPRLTRRPRRAVHPRSPPDAVLAVEQVGRAGVAGETEVVACVKPRVTEEQVLPRGQLEVN